MANPKKKHTRMRRDMRRSANFKLEATVTSKCPQCGVSVKPHHICGSCGFYKGQLILPPKQKKKESN